LGRNLAAALWDDDPALSPRSIAEAIAAPRSALVDAAREAFELGDALGWKSYDRDDILLSPFMRLVPDWSPLAARVLLQIGRRSGSRLRRMLKVPKHREPKAVADFVQAAAMLARNREGWAQPYLQKLSERLLTDASVTPTGRGWGVQYPWVSRFGGTAAGEANIYTTTVVCRALLDDYELERRPASLDAALDGVGFILGDLGTFTHRGLTWLRYTKNATNPIINIQASSASLFVRAAEHMRDGRLVDAADRAAATVIASQAADGSWTYSDDGRGAFVDGFHSGFTLQGLKEYTVRRQEQAVPGTLRAIDLGFAYFKNHLLTRDGRPRAAADGRVSLDGQNVAQAIQTLVVCGDESDARAAAGMWRLATEERRFHEPDFPALRWSIGPLVLATAFLLEAADALEVGRHP
jgi:polysaccharide biosynthesis protein VpsJ